MTISTANGGPTAATKLLAGTDSPRPPLHPCLRVMAFCGSTNRNALVGVWYTICIALSVGLAFSGVTALYLQDITNSNSKVGYAEGLFGVMGLAPGLLGGYVSDKGRRDRVIRWSGIINIAGVLALTVLLVTDVFDSSMDDALNRRVRYIGTWKFIAVCTGISILYAANSIGYAATQALIADSLTTGDRQSFMTKLRILQNLCYTVGPLLCAVIVAAKGDQWNETNLVILVVAGIAFRLPAAYLCFQFNDDDCLRAESDGIADCHCADEAALARYASVPKYYFLSDILWCFGSGMTVKFFPIFFKNDPDAGEEGIGLAPTTLFIISATALFLVIPMSWAGLALSRHFGRIQTDLVMWYVGIASLGGMCAMGYAGHYTSSFWDRFGVLALYLNRTAFLQATGPIQQSVMMDYVGKKTRARWASAYAITGVGWCGSAAVGGWLVDKYGYNVAFLVTCCFHLVSTTVRYPLLWIVPRRAKTLAEMTEEAGKGGGYGTASAGRGATGDEEAPAPTPSAGSRTGDNEGAFEYWHPTESNPLPLPRRKSSALDCSGSRRTGEKDALARGRCGSCPAKFCACSKAHGGPCQYC